MRTFWLSFCDPDKPEGTRFLGACVVEVSDFEAKLMALTLKAKFPHAAEGAEWIAAATRKAHELRCNPGGEVASVEITDAPAEKLALCARGKLMSKAEIEALDEQIEATAAHGGTR